MSAIRSAPHPNAVDRVLAPSRLAALHRTALLDSAADGAFDRFTRLAARLLGVPVALVSLVDADRQFFTSSRGLPEPWATARETPLTHSFCQHVVATRAPLVVTDARTHPLVCDNLAVPDIGVVAYLGVPIEAEGEVLGSLCAIDGAARPWTAAEVAALEDVAALVQTEIALRASVRATEESQRTAALLLQASPDAFLAVDAEDRCTYASERSAAWLGAPAAQLVGAPLHDLMTERERAAVAALHARARETGVPVTAEYQTDPHDGGPPRWLTAHAVADPDGGVAMAVRDVTARRKAERDAQASADRLQRALDAAQMVTWERDIRPVAHDTASRATPERTRRAASGLGASSTFPEFFTSVHPDDRAAIAEATRRAIAADAAADSGGDTGTAARPAYDVEFRVVGLDGEVTWRRATGRVIRDDAGRPRTLAGVTVDITARKQHETALQASEARHRALFAASPLPMWVYDIETLRFLAVNAAAVAQYGWTEAEFLAMTLADIRPPEDAGAVTADIAAAPPGLRQASEWRHRTRAGHVRDVVVTSHPLAFDGRAARLVLVTDVTERKAAEAALRRSEARYRAVVEQSPEPVCLHRDAHLVYANPAGARVLGYDSGAALVGQSLFTILHPDDHAAAMLDLGQRVAGVPQHEPQHYRLVRPDGRVVEVESLSASVDYDGVPAVQTLLRDVTERNRLERQLTHQAFHDALTGLPNRALFLDRLRQALYRRAAGRATSGAGAQGVAVIYLDLDDFKTVNDSLGHAEGDALLREVGGRLQRATRGCDTVARLGGDEFAVLLDAMGGADDAAVVVERVRRALAIPVRLGDGAGARDVRAGASVGVAHARGGESAEELLRDADLAMYRAKAGGRKGGHAVFEPGMHAALVARMELEADLRRALAAPDASGLWVAYQPIVDLASGRVQAFEALARWTRAGVGDPTGALVSPGEFVPIAEASGLVAPLGGWVLQRACAQVAAWRRAVPGAEALRVSVNVSGHQLEDLDALVADVRAALARAALPADALVLEMTESVLMQRTAETLRQLGALKALGVSLAIDDFGTGYSSLAYLQRFPMDVLKLDKAFVDGVADEVGDQAIARTVVALGTALGLRVVAEGVEREDQRAALAAMGCGSAQGYLFARPLGARAASQWLADAVPAPTAGRSA